MQEPSTGMKARDTGATGSSVTHCTCPQPGSGGQQAQAIFSQRRPRPTQERACKARQGDTGRDTT